MCTTRSPNPSLFDVLETVLLCSERAATIARQIKLQYSAFGSLVQQKLGTEANARFNVDVKTLADVLIQEVVRFDLNKRFPGFGQSVFGEENNQFYNEATNETIIVQMSDSMQEVSAMLFRVFGDGDPLARRLAEIATQPLDQFWESSAMHRLRESAEQCKLDRLKSVPAELDQCAVWIDPIDSTAEYVRCPVLTDADASAPLGATTDSSCSPIGNSFSCPVMQLPGQLVNVTVLIGVFNRVTGKLTFGVVNQPFYVSSPARTASNGNEDLYSGRIFWGTSGLYPVVSINCTTSARFETLAKPVKAHYQLPDQLLSCAQSMCGVNMSKMGLRVVCSSVEFEVLDSAFQDWPHASEAACSSSSQVVLFSSPGAGFKLLCVIMDQMDVYLVLKPNTYWWDTCAPHAILRALNGGLLRLKPAIRHAQHLLSSGMGNMHAALCAQLDQFEVQYLEKTTSDTKSGNALYCNSDGFLAYRSRETATKILLHLAKHFSSEETFPH